MSVDQLRLFAARWTAVRLLINNIVIFEELRELIEPAIGKLIASPLDVFANDFNEMLGKSVNSITWQIKDRCCTFTNVRTRKSIRVEHDIFSICLPTSQPVSPVVIINDIDRPVDIKLNSIQLTEATQQIDRVRKFVDCELCSLANTMDSFASPRAIKCLKLGLWFCADHECECAGPHVLECDYLDPASSETWANFNRVDTTLDCRCSVCSADCDLLVKDNSFICRFCEEQNGAHICFQCQKCVYPEDLKANEAEEHYDCIGSVHGINGTNYDNLLRLLNYFVEHEFEQAHEITLDALDSFTSNGRMFPVEGGRWVRNLNIPSSLNRYPLAVESLKAIYTNELEHLDRLARNIRKTKDFSSPAIWDINYLRFFIRDRRPIGIQSDLFVLPRIDPYPIGFSPPMEAVIKVRSKYVLPANADTGKLKLFYMSRTSFGILTETEFSVYVFAVETPLYSYARSPALSRSRSVATLGSPSSAMLIVSQEGSIKPYYMLTIHVGIIRKTIPLIAKNISQLRLKFPIEEVTKIATMPHKANSFAVGFWIGSRFVGCIEVELLNLLETSIDYSLKSLVPVDDKLLECFHSQSWSYYFPYPHFITPDYSELVYFVWEPTTQSYQSCSIHANMLRVACVGINKNVMQFYEEKAMLSVLRMRGPSWLAWFYCLPIVSQNGWMMPYIDLGTDIVAGDFGYYSTMTMVPCSENPKTRFDLNIYTLT